VEYYPVPSEQDIGWAPEQFSTLWSTRKALTPSGNSNMISRTSSMHNRHYTDSGTMHWHLCYCSDRNESLISEHALFRDKNLFGLPATESAGNAAEMFPHRHHDQCQSAPSHNTHMYKRPSDKYVRTRVRTWDRHRVSELQILNL
jgi:hypothetical protein